MAAPPSPPERIILLGRVAAAFGVQGWVKLQPYTAEPDGLLDYDAYWFGGETPSQRYEVEQAQVHGRTVLCKLRGVETREQAERLKAVEFGVSREEMPASGENEIYWADLIGLQVWNIQGAALGTITQMIDNGAQSVMVVAEEAPSRRERLIPFVPAFVQEVSLTQRRVLVDWGEDF